jgi:glycerol-3-phosphate acyltransferase PlsY
MTDILNAILVAAVAYLLGSIPMGVLLARAFGWDDPRTHGSQHTGAMNVSRRAGKAALVIVLLADFLKGVAAVLIAPLIWGHPAAILLAGVVAVAGHCWPVWLRFKGGMGLATGMGAVAVYAWPALLFAGVALAILRFVIVKHTPRAVIFAALLSIPASWLMRFSLPVFALVACICALVAARHTIDWDRRYE